MIDYTKDYKYWELLKMYDEGMLHKNDIIVDNFEHNVNKDKMFMKDVINGRYAIEHLIATTFKIKEKILMTFLEAKEKGTPYHIIFGYNYTAWSATEFTKVMDEKAWHII